MNNIAYASLPELKPAGLDPDLFPPEDLFYWLAQPRNPVFTCDDPMGRMFIERMLTGEPVSFVYQGGSEPGAVRTISVSLVFQHEPEGRIYISGYCLERKANRVFALDLVMQGCLWN